MVGTLSDPKTQLGGFINVSAAAAFSKAFLRGVKPAALGRAVPSMTVRDFVTGGGPDADLPLEGFRNHVISEVSNAADHGKDIRMGDLLGDALYSSGIAPATGIIATQGTCDRWPCARRGSAANPDSARSPPHRTPLRPSSGKCRRPTVMSSRPRAEVWHGRRSGKATDSPLTNPE